MLDIALVNFIGAGLTSIAPAYGLDCPQGAITNGKILIQSLFQCDRINTQDVVERTVKAIWRDWLDSGIPNSVAIEHLEHLPGILETNQPDVDVLIGAMAVASTSNKLGRGTIDAQARRLATDVVERARVNDSLNNAGLSDAVTFYFFEAIYLHLLASKKFIDSMQHQLEIHVSQRPWEFATPDTPADAADDAAPHAEAAGPDVIDTIEANTMFERDDTAAEQTAAEFPADDNDDRLSVAAPDETSAAVAIAEAAIAKRAVLGAAPARTTERSRETCRRLLASLAELSCSDDDYAAALRQSRDHIVAGRLAEAEAALAEAENSVLAAAETGTDAAEEHLERAAEARALRGRLQEVLFEFRRAARHYATAVRHIPREDYQARWTYIDQQARALVHQDEVFGDRDALQEAVRLCTGIIAILHDDRASVCQAQAKTLLGKLTTLIGRKDREAAQFELAARHLREAIAFFVDCQADDAANEATLALADALYGLGTLQQDHHALEEAVRLYQQALTAAASDAAEAHELTGTKLAIALAGLGLITRNDDILSVAIETLHSCLDDLQNAADQADTVLLQGHANAALAQALVAKAELANSSEDLAAALPIYALAISALDGSNNPAELAQLSAEYTEISQALGLADPAEQPEPAQAAEPAPGADPAPDATADSPAADDYAPEGGYLTRLRASLKLSTTADATPPSAAKRRPA